MRRQVITIVVLACFGGVLSSLVLRVLRSDRDVSQPAPTTQFESAEPSAAPSNGKSTSSVRAAPPPKAEAEDSLGSREVAQANRQSDPAPQSQETFVADAVEPATKTLSLPESTLPAAADQSESLKALLNSSTIRCDIYAVHGANWSSGKAILQPIGYHGGPFSYQAIDIESGTATMTGTVGVTGSPMGEMEVRVTPSTSGLTFTGFTRRGELVIVTVYAAVDAEGHYRAVMSRHAPKLSNLSAQFYGGCDTTLTQR